MKKVLFATSALVATAGVASADVAVTGWAEMGIYGGSGMETQFFTDIDVLFRMSGETDNGLTFGAGVDLDENGAFTTNDDGGAFVFISGDFGTVTMGDTDGALDWALTEAWVGNAGSINDDETGHGGALGAYGDGAYDGQILRYDNTFGDFGVAISFEMDDTGARDAGYAVGFRYGLDMGGADLNIGIGYQFIDAMNYNPGNTNAFTGQDLDGEYDILGISVSTTLASGLSIGIEYTDYNSNEADDEYTHMGVGIGYSMDAFSVSANYGMWDIDADGGAPDEEITGFGIAAAYDLGGGASIHLGYGNTETDAAAGADADSWSFGVAMSF